MQRRYTPTIAIGAVKSAARVYDILRRLLLITDATEVCHRRAPRITVESGNMMSPGRSDSHTLSVKSARLPTNP